MNAYLGSIGCRNTHFVNPHGLHQSEHTTTAYDMGLIACKAMAHPKFREIVATLDYLKPATNKHPEEHLKMFNHLLRPGKFFYPKAIGVKTGYTSHAQNTLVAAAIQDGRTLIAVLLGCEKRDDRYADARALFEAAFAEQKIRRVLFAGNEQYHRTIEGAKSSLQAVLGGEMAIEYYPAEEPLDIKACVYWKVPSLPIRKGDSVAEMRVMDGKGNLLQSAPLFAKEEVKGSLFFTLKQWWNILNVIQKSGIKQGGAQDSN
jgi:D-alanyl-D-alanine carboxypeptidase (penicillin-binding protein 5/6)